ncbi:hypothetical protein OG21DRAFT_1524243 [Imleria badia]|nr:hypothetical protein OG21DRAFT_1524243 [Imleria badia]
MMNQCLLLATSYTLISIILGCAYVLSSNHLDIFGPSATGFFEDANDWRRLFVILVVVLDANLGYCVIMKELAIAAGKQNQDWLPISVQDGTWQAPSRTQEHTVPIVPYIEVNTNCIQVQVMDIGFRLLNTGAVIPLRNLLYLYLTSDAAMLTLDTPGVALGFLPSSLLAHCQWPRRFNNSHSEQPQTGKHESERSLVRAQKNLPSVDARLSLTWTSQVIKQRSPP